MKSVIFGLGVLALAQAAAAADIQVGHSWARATLPGMSMGGVFMQVVNGDADNILVLDQGRLAEQGTHAQLLRKKGLYAEMWTRQASERERLSEAAE